MVTKAMRIHIFRPDLLGARLLNLAYGAALADLCGRSFELHWPTFHKFVEQSGYERGNNLYDLYDCDLLSSSAGFAYGKLSEGPFAQQASWGDDLIHLVKASAFKGVPISIDQLLARNEDVIFSHVDALSINGLEAMEWHARARDKLRGLPERAEIRAAEDDVLQKLPRGRIAAIHIRRGDVVADLLRQPVEAIGLNKHLKAVSNFQMRFVPIEVYKSYLREGGFDGALLFSDEEGIVDKSGFRDILPVVDVTQLVQKLPLSKIQKDFIEIRIMARGDELLASQSRFSQLASLYAGRAATDLSGRGTVQLVLEELYRDYGLTEMHAIHSPLEAALRRTLVEC